MSLAGKSRTPDYRNLYPFESRYRELGAAKMHYVDHGPHTDSPLLMLHGNPTWSFYYRRLIEYFGRSTRVVAPDHIGCGLSDKPEAYTYRLEQHINNLVELVTGLDLWDINLVVHDWGGAIGMGFATRFPERVRRLVVLNTAAFPSDRMPKSIGFCRLPIFGDLAIRGFNVFARAALRWCVVHKDRLDREVRAGYLSPYRNWASRVGNLRFVQDIPMDNGHPSYPQLEQISEQLSGLKEKPMLICWGAQDFVFDDAFLSEWTLRFPNAEVHRFVDAGHYVLEDAHERIIPLIERFLSGNSRHANG